MTAFNPKGFVSKALRESAAGAVGVHSMTFNEAMTNALKQFQRVERLSRKGMWNRSNTTRRAMREAASAAAICLDRVAYEADYELSRNDAARKAEKERGPVQLRS